MENSIVTLRTNHVQTYALHDVDAQAHGGAIRISRERDASDYNARGFGIFQTVQVFYGPRKIKNLVHVNAWIVDMDSGTKSEMMARINLGLLPTMVVETKKGYHVYWKAKDATSENYKKLVELRLVPFYKGDNRAKDLPHIFRVPGYLHQKDPMDPFLIQKVHEAHVEYSEREMFTFYKDLKTVKKQKRLHNETRKLHPISGDFWDRVWNLNCEEALTRLSGSPHVGGETYEFRDNSSGTKNIYVNGKGTSCWIDTDGRIGSTDDGGPTIARWLYWFHKDYKRVVEIIKQEFPECQTTPQLSLL